MEFLRHLIDISLLWSTEFSCAITRDGRSSSRSSPLAAVSPLSPESARTVRCQGAAPGLRPTCRKAREYRTWDLEIDTTKSGAENLCRITDAWLKLSPA